MDDAEAKRRGDTEDRAADDGVLCRKHGANAPDVGLPHLGELRTTMRFTVAVAAREGDCGSALARIL